MFVTWTANHPLEDPELVNRETLVTGQKNTIRYGTIININKLASDN